MVRQATRLLAAAAVLAAVSLSNLALAGDRVTSAHAFNVPSASRDTEPVETRNDSAKTRCPSEYSCNDANGCGKVRCDGWCSPTWYGQADTLVWWMKGNNVPALVTESPNGTPRPNAGVLGRDTTEIVFGDTGIDDNSRLGLRLTVGYWLDDCQVNGLEATWFSLGDGANTGNFYDAAAGDTSVIVARPFFNAALNAQDAQLVAFPDIVDGSVQSQTNSEMHSLAVLLRHNLGRNCDRRVDLVGGYRFLRFRESLTIREQLTSQGFDLIPQGTTFDVLDSFDTENDFHGGEIGLNTVWTRGCWDFDVLTKLALGNMHHKARIDGQTIVDTHISPDVPVVSSGGLLALHTNIGTSSWDEFAMVPELNLNLRYHFSECLSLTAGYSLLWVTDVARTGDQIDFAVNPNQLPPVPIAVGGGTAITPARPAPMLGTTDMWAQGLNLGVVWAY